MEKKMDLEYEIDTTKKRIAELMQRIREYKQFHPQYKNDGVYKSMSAEVAHLQSKMVKLKQTRKVTVSAMKQLRWKIFTELVAEKIGQDETDELIKQSKEQMKQYQYDVRTRTFRKK